MAEIDVRLQNRSNPVESLIESHTVTISWLPMKVDARVLQLMVSKEHGSLGKRIDFAPKLSKSGRLLRCQIIDHNACIPAFTQHNGVVTGEFNDNFVRLEKLV